MKKYIQIFLIAGVTFFGLSSCAGFLDTEPTASIPKDGVFETIQGAEAALSGCYWQLESGNGGAGRPDDWGYATHLMTYSVCGEDMTVWGGWYGYDYNFWGHTRGDIFKSPAMWNFYYRLINNVNAVITYTPDSYAQDVKQKEAVLGQAYAMRGWAYFQLIRLYQHTYIIAQDMPGVPIYTEPTEENTEGKPRGTVEDTYKQILDDLLEGERLLKSSSFQRAAKNRIDLNVCQGFLAQVYLTMNNWPKAAEYANAARQGYPLTTNAQYTSGFNDLSTSSWMWGVAQTKDQNMGDYSPFALWATWSRNGFSFECFFLVDEFVKLFDNPSDIRGQQISLAWSNNTVYSSRKFLDNDNLTGNIVYMRSEEMLLIEAEALARNNDPNGAKALLQQLQQMRGATVSQTSGDELIEDILIERRKEMYGEGHDWFDIIRNQKSIERKGQTHLDRGGSVQFPARSWRFIYQVPFSEITNNSSMVDGIWPAGDQNPFSGVYNP